VNANPSHDRPGDSQPDLNDPVWRLLDRAPLPEPDAWFAARTLARCRHEGLSVEPGWIAFARVWRWMLGGGVGLSLGIALVATQVRSESATHLQQKNVQEAFAIVASLGTDSDSSFNTGASSWQDSSL
jgi:hypothetical protein